MADKADNNHLLITKQLLNCKDFTTPHEYDFCSRYQREVNKRNLFDQLL